MKFLFAIFLLTSSAQASQNLFCVATVTSQTGSQIFQTDAKLNFRFENRGNQSVISAVNGYINVKDAYTDQNAPISEENSYMGVFRANMITANSAYHPNKYKDYAQFANFKAVKTMGVEQGMWGSLVVQTSAPAGGKILAKYIFQAGDHMGGTVHFVCTIQKPDRYN
jgi:hypothetical protein